MNTPSSYFKLGLFVISAVTLLVAGVIILGGGELLERKITIETYMDQSVNGLSEGAAVKFKGVQLGTVSEIALANAKHNPDALGQGKLNSAVLIQMELDAAQLANPTEKRFMDWLTRANSAGLRVRMASSGLTGPPYLEFVYLDTKEFPPAEFPWETPPHYVPSVPSEMRVLMDAVDQILSAVEEIDFGRISDEVESLLTSADKKFSELRMDELNDEAIALLREARVKIEDLDTERINENAVTLLEEVRGSNARLHEILDNPSIDPSLDDLRATLENARSASERVREILNDPRVQEIIEQVDDASGEAKPAIEDVRRLVLRIDRLLASQQATIESALQELARAVENINAVTEDAQANPARILFGDPPPNESHGGKQ